MVLARLVPAASNSRIVAFTGRIAVGHRRQRLDIDLDRFKRILGDRRAVGHHNRNRLADVADLVVRDDGLKILLERRQRLLPHRNDSVPDRRYRPP